MAPSILIVGGGFSGVALVHQLARLPWPDGIRIVIADRSGRFGRGVAYSTDHPAHLLNVPAGRMGALAGDEGHFLRWMRTTEPSAAGDAFVPRSRYGDYLEQLFETARRDAPANVLIESLPDEAVSIAQNENRLRVGFRSGAEVPADRVVLAIGNLPPKNLPAISAPVLADRGYVRDPWEPGALNRIAGASSVLVVGSGLTMVDTVIALHHANPKTNFIAVSRHGLLPLSHRDRPTKPIVIEPARAFETWNGSASALLRIFRDEARAAERADLDWRDVLNGLRPITHALWRRMPAREKARFFRHIRPFWDTHRHRMSTRVATEVNGLIARNQLSIVAGRIADCTRDGDRVVVDVRRRDGDPARYRVDALVNCTGPDSDLAHAPDAFVADLRGSGAITPDVLRIGLQTNDHGAVVGADGRESDVLFTLGATRRPGLWESTAVPELRAQADELARRLHTSLGHTGA